PGMGEALIQHKVPPGCHESDGDRAPDPIVQTPEVYGTHSSTREPGAPHSRGIHVGARAEDVKRALVLYDVNARPGGPGTYEAFLHDVFVLPCEGVVFGDRVGIGKVGVAGSLAQAFGYVGGEDTAAGEGER